MYCAQYLQETTLSCSSLLKTVEYVNGGIWDLESCFKVSLPGEVSYHYATEKEVNMVSGSKALFCRGA